MYNVISRAFRKIFACYVVVYRRFLSQRENRQQFFYRSEWIRRKNLLRDQRFPNRINEQLGLQINADAALSLLKNLRIKC
jgi:hypothetical protein